VSGRWLLPAGDTGPVTWTLCQPGDSPPYIEFCFGPGIAPVVQYRDVPGADDLADAAASASAALEDALARYAARPLVPLPGPDLPDLPQREPGAALEALEASVAPFTDPPRDEASYPYPDPGIDVTPVERREPEFIASQPVDVGVTFGALIDPDCVAGKHAICMGGPCQCSCHEPPGPPEAPIGGSTCSARDGNWACTASPGHAGDHASHGAKPGTVAHQWEQAPAP
jgi:hypothetical protein